MVVLLALGAASLFGASSVLMHSQGPRRARRALTAPGAARALGPRAGVAGGRRGPDGGIRSTGDGAQDGLAHAGPDLGSSQPAAGAAVGGSRLRQAPPSLRLDGGRGDNGGGWRGFSWSRRPA